MERTVSLIPTMWKVNKYLFNRKLKICCFWSSIEFLLLLLLILRSFGVVNCQLSSIVCGCSTRVWTWRIYGTFKICLPLRRHLWQTLFLLCKNFPLGCPMASLLAALLNSFTKVKNWIQLYAGVCDGRYLAEDWIKGCFTMPGSGP